MSAWVVGLTYALPSGEITKLIGIEAEGGKVMGTFERRNVRYVVDLATLGNPQSVRARTSADVSLRITFDAQRARDAIADAQATLLADDGWYCISGKHLRIARVADPYVRAIFERASMPDEVKADKLRRKFASTSPAAETKTVDVDTYVALKKLRRARAAVDTFRKATDDKLRNALGSRPRPRLQGAVTGPAFSRHADKAMRNLVDLVKHLGVKPAPGARLSEVVTTSKARIAELLDAERQLKAIKEAMK